MIMADAAIEFKNELFYGDVVKAAVAAGDLSRVGFELYYLMEKEQDGKLVKVAAAKTAMVCYDYTHKRMASLPPELKKALLPPV